MNPARVGAALVLNRGSLMLHRDSSRCLEQAAYPPATLLVERSEAATYNDARFEFNRAGRKVKLCHKCFTLQERQDLLAAARLDSALALERFQEAVEAPRCRVPR